MGQITATVSDFGLTSRWTNSGGSITSGPSTDTQNKTFAISGIPQGATIDGAVLTAYAGSPLTGASVFTVNGVSCSYGRAISVPVTVTGDGSYSIAFVFKANGSASMSDGNHSASIVISEAALTVVYTEVEPVPPEPEPEPEHIANEQIAVFPPTATDYSGNGLVTLNPTEYEVHEKGGAVYEITLVHPLDDYGKWQWLIEEYIIRGPVPKRKTPRIVVPASQIWRVKSGITTTPLYSQLPYYTRTKTDIDKIRDNPSQYEWSASKRYDNGEKCVYGSSIYQYSGTSGQTTAPPTSSMGTYWNYRASLTPGGSSPSGGGSIYHEGTVAENIPGGEMITYIADYNESYIRARSLRGVVGFIRRNDCERTGDSGGSMDIAPRIITEQAFRICSVSVDSEEKTVTVMARHKSYDFIGNSMLDCKIVEADPQTAIAIMQGSLLNADTRLIATNITTGTITADWSWQNPIYALLDPDEGLAKKLKAQVVRDNDDFFLLDNSSPDTGTTLHYGVNLLGVVWERSTDGVITRIVPRGKDKDGNDLFLNDLYVDSEIINSYAFIRVEILDCDCKEGQQIEHADGTKETLTKEKCYDIMEETAQKRFDQDKCDAVAVSLNVRFILLGDTEEYKQYNGLQSVKLYDAIPVIHDLLGLHSTAQMNEYRWDGLRKRYNEVTLGNIFSYGGRTVTGYSMADEAITWRKLAPGLIDKIRAAE